MRIRLFLILSALAVSGIAWAAGPLFIHQHTSSAYGYGAKLVATTSCESAQWTGWINTSIVSDVVFDVDFVDDNTSVTSITMRCETSESGGTANDSGRDYCSASTSAGTSTYTCPLTWSLAVSGSQGFQWGIENVNAQYVNCLYTCAGAPGSGDSLAVTARGVTP